MREPQNRVRVIDNSVVADSRYGGRENDLRVDVADREPAGVVDLKFVGPHRITLAIDVRFVRSLHSSPRQADSFDAEFSILCALLVDEAELPSRETETGRRDERGNHSKCFRHAHTPLQCCAIATDYALTHASDTVANPTDCCTTASAGYSRPVGHSRFAVE